MANPEKDDRVFAPFPIEMDEHPKIIGLSDAAFRAVFEATFYSRRMLSDGFLDERVVMKRWGAEVAEELSSNDPEKPSWIRVSSPRPGWQIHDFEKHHPLRADIEAKRADVYSKRSEAGRKGAAKRWQKNGNGMANDSSESESESETLTSSKTLSVSQVTNARANLTDEEKAQIDSSMRLAAGIGVDLGAVIKHAGKIGRVIDHPTALGLATHILTKAPTEPDNPTGYIVAAFKSEPFVMQQWIDREVIV